MILLGLSFVSRLLWLTVINKGNTIPVLYKSTTGRTVTIGAYIVTVYPGMLLPERLEILDEQVGISLSLNGDVVLLSKPEKPVSIIRNSVTVADA